MATKRRQQAVVFGRRKDLPQRYAGQRLLPAIIVSQLAQNLMRRCSKVRGHLHGQHATLGELCDQPGQQLPVIAKPVQCSVRENEIRRKPWLPGDNIALLPVDRRGRRCGFPEHSRILVHADDHGLWPMFGEQAGDVASAAAEVKDILRAKRRQAGRSDRAPVAAVLRRI
jgi:hypothetical protein